MTDLAPALDIRPAATVMVVRDGGAGLEVLMLLRHPDSVFAANAWVFPGGAVDPADATLPVALGPNDEEASAVLGLPAGGLAYFVAAARECFEEAGLLMADVPPVRNDLDAARFTRLRRDVHAGRRTFAAVLAAEGVALDLGGMRYVSHWITPPGGTRRFDTRFFLAVAPPDQLASHDAAETVESLWTSPASALARHAAGEIHLVYPTIKNLQVLARYPTAAAALSLVPPRPARPEPSCPT